MLAADDFSYQKIELPHGFSTSGRHDRSSTAKRIFPDDLSGKSVLDVGCRLGYFCFEALKRGAERVVGVDIDPDNVRKARLLADCLGFEARFEQLDIDREPIRESFDYVLGLNILHHLANPIGSLEQLAGVARERLVLEVAALRRTRPQQGRRAAGLRTAARAVSNHRREPDRRRRSPIPRSSS